MIFLAAGSSFLLCCFGLQPLSLSYLTKQILADFPNL